jgi:hypothetical protein
VTLRGCTGGLRAPAAVFALLPMAACGTHVSGVAVGGPDGPPVADSGYEPGDRHSVAGPDDARGANDTAGASPGGSGTGEGSTGRGGTGQGGAGIRATTGEAGDQDEGGASRASGRRPDDGPVTNPGGGGSGGGRQGGASSTEESLSGGDGQDEATASAGADLGRRPAVVAVAGPSGPVFLEERRITVRQDVPRTIEVRNDGEEDVVVDNPELQGPGSDAFSVDATSCSGVVLAPAQSCAVEVSYLPTEAAGTETATLVIPFPGDADVQRRARRKRWLA